MRQVACPVVLRTTATQTEYLAFEHPLAGQQIVKGGIEIGEDISVAALRELDEEAGVKGISTTVIGSSADISPNEIWHFVQVQISADDQRRAYWTHLCSDDGGHGFRFFWQPLSQNLPQSHDARFDRATCFIRQRSL